MSTDRPRVASRLAGIGTSIFAEMTSLAVRHGAVNLGQGFPDFDGPEFVKLAAEAAIRAGYNQYERMPGLLPLTRAIAEHERRFYGLAYDPESEITVHAGATEAIFATLLALLDGGDEILAFEPFYDSYPACATLAGAKLVGVPLAPPAFALDLAALEAAITPRTRALLLNSPNNPAGRVFTREELAAVAAFCQRHDLLAVTDEVYEHIVFEGAHVPLACLPGMRERTVTISSTGKTFSLTGWKIGFTCAPAPLAAAVRTVHQFVTFCIATPFQHAMATALATGDEYFATLHAAYRARRERLCDGLSEAGFDVHAPEGTYFALADIRPLGYSDDVDFCRRLPEAVGVAAIPVSAFCSEGSPTRHLVRFAFCKRDTTIDEGLARLRRLRR
jgi:N-succinyldiaminopimelate aminotransferase